MSTLLIYDHGSADAASNHVQKDQEFRNLGKRVRRFGAVGFGFQVYGFRA